MAEIRATRKDSKTGIVATKRVLVDDSDYGWLNLWAWHWLDSGYIFREENRRGKRKAIYLHRVIMDTPAGMNVDHKDHDKSNNRRANLRNCTYSENARNQLPQGGSSRYKGVCWDNRDKKWRADIQHNGKGIYLGLFTDDLDAAEAYDRAAVKYHGEFACLNNIIPAGETGMLFQDTG